MATRTSVDPFSSKNILNNEPSSINPHDTWHGFKLDGSLQSETLHLADTETIKVPVLQTDVLELSLDVVSLEQNETSESETSTVEAPAKIAHDPKRADKGLDDVWDLAALSANISGNGLLSWDTFYSQYKEAVPTAKYVTEADPVVYDKILDRIWRARKETTLNFVRPHLFHQALVNLVQGRSSSFFVWDSSTAKFYVETGDFTLSGYTPEFTAQVCNLLGSVGTFVRKISIFCRSSRRPLPTLHAIQSAFQILLGAVESHLHGRNRQDITLVELRCLAYQYNMLLSIMDNVMTIATSENTERTMLTSTIRCLDDAWLSETTTQEVIGELAARILEPSLRRTSEQLELCLRQSDIEEDPWSLADLLPDLAHSFEETTACLTTIRCQLSHTSILPSASPIQLMSTWKDLSLANDTAEALESQVRSHLQQHAQGPALYAQECLSTPSEFCADPFKLDSVLPNVQPALLRAGETKAPDCLATFVSEFLEESRTHDVSDLSPMQALRLSLTPFVRLQHRVSSYALMRVLFLQHNLKTHFELLHSFELFGNGLFAARLSRALFDAGEHSAEGRRPNGLSAGLRLEDREAWPPASSELRLVLMGLLSESADGTPIAILDCISFAIRDLDEAELERCRDVHSVHALDFLRLTYTPNNAITELIITPIALERYDRIFKFLLLTIRLHALTQSMMVDIVCHQPKSRPQPLRYRAAITLHHFITSLLDFAINVAIWVPWTCFIKRVSDICSALQDDDYQRSISLAGSITQLRKLHEDTLDGMLKSLLLKKKQVTAYSALCGLFSVALKFNSTAPRDDSLFYTEVKIATRTLLEHLFDITQKSSDPAFQRIEQLSTMLDLFGQLRTDLKPVT